MATLGVIEDIKTAINGLIVADTGNFTGVSVLYREPVDGEELRGTTGNRELIYWEPSGDGETPIRYVGGGPVVHSVTGALEQTVQVVALDTDTTRTTVEARALTLADAVIDLVAADLEVGIAATWTNLQVTCGGWAIDAGRLNDLDACRVTLTWLFDLNRC